jgi:uncharacterized membrane protein YccC
VRLLLLESFLVHDSTIIGGLAIIALLLDFHLLQLIKVGATFITIYVIFIYGILAPDIDNLIQYRVVDTLVGSFILSSFFFLWPSWNL